MGIGGWGGGRGGPSTSPDEKEYLRCVAAIKRKYNGPAPKVSQDEMENFQREQEDLAEQMVQELGFNGAMPCLRLSG